MNDLKFNSKLIGFDKDIEQEKDNTKMFKITCGACTLMGGAVFTAALFKVGDVYSIFEYIAASIWLASAGYLGKQAANHSHKVKQLKIAKENFKNERN